MKEANELLEIWKYVKQCGVDYYYPNIYNDKHSHHRFWYTFLHDENILLQFWTLKAKIEHLQKENEILKSKLNSPMLEEVIKQYVWATIKDLEGWKPKPQKRDEIDVD